MWCRSWTETAKRQLEIAIYNLGNSVLTKGGNSIIAYVEYLLQTESKANVMEYLKQLSSLMTGVKSVIPRLNQIMGLTNTEIHELTNYQNTWEQRYLDPSDFPADMEDLELNID